MTELVCLKDSYARECESVVAEASGNRVVLDRTVFYPAGGGQPGDFGKITGANKNEYEVVDVRKESGKIIHFVENSDGATASLEAGEKVVCEIDWERRYALMRMHTAAHVLGSAMYGKGYLITGNQLGTRETRFDFSMENFDRQLFEQIVQQANERLAENIELKVYELAREEALKIPEVVKLAGALPPNIPFLRIVEIPGVDLQADGGTHVRNTREVGAIEIAKLENKGAKNKRVYFRLAPHGQAADGQ